MHPANIVAKLKVSGSSSSQIARDLGIRPAVVSNVIHGRTTSSKVASRIAEITGLPIDKLFPDLRYSDDNRQAA